LFNTFDLKFVLELINFGGDGFSMEVQLAFLANLRLNLFLVLISSGIVFLASGWLKQRALDKWRQETGRAPVFHVRKRDQYSHMQAVMLEVPAELRKKLVLYDWITGMSWLFSALVILISLYGASRR
jgi:hypothetical protein